MASTAINPNRMELIRLKGRLQTALGGCKLLKNKQAVLTSRLGAIARQSLALRSRVEEELFKAKGSLAMAAAVMGPAMAEQALLYPSRRIRVTTGLQNLAGVTVPQYTMETAPEHRAAVRPYGFAQTCFELDMALDILSRLSRDMLKLAELEKTQELLTAEIENTRRRIRALERVTIPAMRRNSKHIAAKLEDSERYAKIRLMKGKGFYSR